MKQHWKKLISNQEGATLMCSIMLLLTLSLVGLNVAQLSAASTVQGSLDTTSQKARYASHAGLEQAFDRLYYGNDPSRPAMNVFGGELLVTTDPALRLITSKGTFEGVTIEQTVEALFSADCFEIDFSNSAYTQDVGANKWSYLSTIEARKNCADLDRVKVSQIRLLYGAPDATRLTQHINIDTSSVLYHVQSSSTPSGFPSHADTGTPTGGAKSKEIITPSGYVFHDTATHDMEIWWDTTFGSSDPYAGYYDPNNPNKVLICHNGNTLSVSINGWENGHSNHSSDYLGACGAPAPNTGSVALQIEVTFHDGSVYTSPVKNLP